MNKKQLKKMQDSIYKKQIKEIEKIYINIARKIDKKLEGYNEDTFSVEDLEKIKKEIKKEIKENRKEIISIIDNNIGATIGISYRTHEDIFKKIDKKYKTNLSEAYKEKTKEVEKKVKKKVTSGEIYRDNYPLSKRIWGSEKKTLNDINKIINNGLKEKRDPYSIAKDLEKYVNPKEKKDWSWGNIYPGCAKKVDYNAQRLARTTLTHSHQLSMQEYAKRNPIVEYLEYNSAHNSRTCEMCADRDGTLYKKDDVPLDHPNGNCFMTVYIPDNIEDMIAQMANEGTLEDILEDL